jgi:hypothetical protein
MLERDACHRCAGHRTGLQNLGAKLRAVASAPADLQLPMCPPPSQVDTIVSMPTARGEDDLPGRLHQTSRSATCSVSSSAINASGAYARVNCRGSVRNAVTRCVKHLSGTNGISCPGS